MSVTSRFDGDDEYDERWRDRAACRSSDPNLFFPAGNTGSAIDTIEAAKAVCRSCSVAESCLRFALATNQEDGIWGGRDEVERRRLRRVWREARRPVKQSAMA